MSLQKKVGRLLIAGFHGKTVSEKMKHLIHTYHIGGVILFVRNIGTPAEVLELTRNLQKEAKAAGYATPLLICLDQENGTVRRISEGTTAIPGAMLLGATRNPRHAFQAGILTGKEMKALGINWNLAPVVDINNNPQNPVIGVRSFGEEAHSVAEMAEQFMLGMREAGVMSTLKHFPGHGDTSVDSHRDLPVISHDLKRLHEVELVPFKKCIASGADAVMSAHVYFPALEKEPNKPATLSHSVITGLLREELGFDGVITTDCMEMDAIINGIGTVKGCVKAVEAGVDMVMVSHSHAVQEQAVLELAEAVERGGISEQQVDQSIERIERMISGCVSWDDVWTTHEVEAFIGSQAHHDKVKGIYQDGITLVGERGAPIKTKDKVLVVHTADEYSAIVEDLHIANSALAEKLQIVHEYAEACEIDLSRYEDELAALEPKLKKHDHIVVLTSNAARIPEQQKLVAHLIDSGKPVDVVAVRTPYDAALFPGANRRICTYEYTPAALEVAAEALAGKTEVKGQLPVTLEHQGNSNQSFHKR
ncbi:beta-N-acetylhexosaminidase [Planomicrobium sp. CPCC 101110]|uniref:beta-N-acetylhexosaminidase n=1 Tax=Planomicrobium sp. CPCC 101110 TaxID=2599619 RepID=UPI0011B36E26|nr:beta-N-acetylhexosaminidase [Planomicrobium sp. CPCC 101110]TWT25374.1 beta-N-acetylhexosaminidase [Planomicrobium sp. CPCC 101110]